MRSTLVCFALLAPMWAADGPPYVFPIVLEKNLPLASIRVGDSEPLWFILDSAAAHCVVDTAVAQKLGVERIDEAFASGSGGTVSVPLLKSVPIDLAGLRITPKRMLAYDLSGLKFKTPVAGILGMPLFGNYVVEIDYPGLRGRVLEHAKLSGVIFPVIMRSGPVIKAKAKLNGREMYEIDAQVDTGSAHVITFTAPFVQSKDLLTAAEAIQKGETLGFGGASQDATGRIEWLAVGPFMVDHPQVRFAMPGRGSLATSEFEANLGGAFLKDYKVTFDLKNKLVSLVPGVTRY